MKKPLNVLLDTNIFIGKECDLGTMWWQSIKYATLSGDIRLFSHHIIDYEIQNNLRDQQEEMSEYLRHSINKCSVKFIETVRGPIKEVLIAVSNNIYDAKVDAYKKYMQSAEMLSEDIPSEKLFMRYFECRKPFEKNKDKKHEFPDAAIILSIEKFLDENPSEEMLVVTNDSGMRDALRDIQRVRSFESLKEFMNTNEFTTPVTGDALQRYVQEHLPEMQAQISAHDLSKLIDDDTPIKVRLSPTMSWWVHGFDLARTTDLHIDASQMQPLEPYKRDKNGAYAEVTLSGRIEGSFTFFYNDLDNFYWNHRHDTHFGEAGFGKGIFLKESSALFTVAMHDGVPTRFELSDLHIENIELGSLLNS